MLGSLLFMKMVDVVSWGMHGAWGLLGADPVQVAEGGAELGHKLLEWKSVMRTRSDG